MCPSLSSALRSSSVMFFILSRSTAPLMARSWSSSYLAMCSISRVSPLAYCAPAGAKTGQQVKLLWTWQGCFQVGRAGFSSTSPQLMCSATGQLSMAQLCMSSVPVCLQLNILGVTGDLLGTQMHQLSS